MSESGEGRTKNGEEGLGRAAGTTMEETRRGQRGESRGYPFTAMSYGPLANELRIVGVSCILSIDRIA